MLAEGTGVLQVVQIKRDTRGALVHIVQIVGKGLPSRELLEMTGQPLSYSLEADQKDFEPRDGEFAAARGRIR